ncbi:comm domain-containing protein 4-8 family member [Holotrichia oblita]|uniref:Comm domain-containing protein 4-8 family member n=1 Tax=Holotrichia oblita TaxID=644536 RepID=A0ACB9T2H6_HOLOL|nr:comm domain-containing protein 4-8 family member [Holotrichia oblita]
MAGSDINSLLKIGNTADFPKFLHLCVDNMLGKSVSFERCSDDIEWTKEELKSVQLLIQTNFKNNILNNDGVFQFPFENLNETLRIAIEKCYEIRKDEIRQNLIKENLLSKDIPLVENIDWKLKWVMGSSSTITVSEPLLQVDLHCAVGNEVNRKIVNFEMNLSQMDELINKLETARKSVELNSS